MKLFFGKSKLKFTEKKSIFIRYNHVPYAKDTLRAKLGLIWSMTKILFNIIKGLKKRSSKNPVVINCGGAHLEESRTKYLSKYTSYQEFLFLNISSQQYVYDKIDVLVLFRFFNICFKFYLVALLTIFVNSNKENQGRFLNAFSYLLQISLLNKTTNVFCIQIWMPESYIVSRIVSKLGYATTMITSSSPIHCNNRYVFAPEVDLKYASKFQKEELRILTERRHFVVKSVQKWGPENVDDFANIKKGDIVFDVGLYSGGSWARNKKNLRVNNADYLLDKDREFNDYYRVFEMILDSLIKLKNENPNLRMAVFPHPHERNLLKNNIKPPYFDKIHENGFSFEGEMTNSIDSFFKTKIGVAVNSTSIFDRIDCDLKGGVYSGKSIKNNSIAPHYLGMHSNICFGSSQELEKMIKEELQISPNA